jgi:hypothetical protein
MRPANSDGEPLGGFGVAAVAVACCAGLPALAGVLGGISVALLLGLGGGTLVVGVAAGAAIFVRGRCRRPCRADTNRLAGVR